MAVIFQCFGLTGVILLFYGLIGFAITQVSSTFFWVLMVTGGILLLIFLITSRNVFKSLFQLRSLRHGTTSTIYTVIAVCILAVLNVVSQDFHVQKDFTENKVNLLAEQTVNILKNLKHEVNIRAFFDNRNQIKPALKILLQKYKNETGNIKVAYVDPDKDKILAQKYDARDGDIIIEYQGQTHVTHEVSEQAITQSIMKVTRTETPTVCFTKGHGELSTEAGDEDVRSMSFAKSAIENEGYKSKVIDNLLPSVPKDCSILVVAGPTQTFLKSCRCFSNRKFRPTLTPHFFKTPSNPVSSTAKLVTGILGSGVFGSNITKAFPPSSK